jgi:hypothetical protein
VSCKSLGTSGLCQYRFHMQGIREEGWGGREKGKSGPLRSYRRGWTQDEVRQGHGIGRRYDMAQATGRAHTRNQRRSGGQKTESGPVRGPEGRGEIKRKSDLLW